MDKSRRTQTTTAIAGLLLLTISLLAVAPLTGAVAQYGVTTVGSTNYPTGTLGNAADASNIGGLDNTLVATKYVLASDATVIKIGGYAATAGHWKLAIYTDNAGSPDTLVAANNNVNAVAAGANEFDIGPVYLTAGTYWIAILDDTASVRKYNLGVGDAVYTIGYGFSNSMPASFGTPSGTQNNEYVAYCKYVQIEGYAKATKISVASAITVSSVNFYSHTTGNFRVAIYSDSSGPSTKLWESSNTAASAGWNSVSITTGTPTSLSLPAGTYWLVWQWDSANLGPSYTAASSGDGNAITMAYGSFPATWTGGAVTSEQWSIYITDSGITPTPENPLGALLALVICFGAFAVFIKVRKTKTK